MHFPTPFRTTKRSHYLLPAMIFVVGIAIWELCVLIFQIPIYLIPSPARITLAIAQSWRDLIADASVTLSEAFLGFGLGTSTAFCVAWFFVRYKSADHALRPYVVAFQAVPLVAIAPLLIIWFGNGLFSKVVMAGIICFFPMIVTTSAGFRNVSGEELDLMTLLSASPYQVFTKLRIPKALPFIFSGLRVSATFSVIGAIVAELAGATRGIGFRLMVASYQTDTPMLFAAALFAAASGIVFYHLVTMAEAVCNRIRYGR